MPLSKKIPLGLYRLFHFIFGSIIGRLLYSPRFFPKGGWFRHWYSQGYTWVWPDFWGRVLFHRNRGIPWPCSPFSVYVNNIEFDPDNLHNFQGTGCYFQAWDAKITIGPHCYIASNVALITSNHNIYDLDTRSGAADIVLGHDCWVGFGAVLLPGTRLGPHTVVAAGATITQSFPDGYVILGGTPARVIKTLDPNDFQEKENEGNDEFQ